MAKIREAFVGLHRHAHGLAAVADGQPVRDVRRHRRIGAFDLAAAAQLREQVDQLVALADRGALFDELAYVRERRGEPRIVDGLENVVDGACLEGLHGEAVVGRHEHDHRQLVRLQFGQDVETGESRHLDVQEYQVGLELADGLQRFAAIAALPDDLDVVGDAQPQLQAAARQRLVVDQQGP